jgi:hypothetical protein
MNNLHSIKPVINKFNLSDQDIASIQYHQKSGYTHYTIYTCKKIEENRIVMGWGFERDEDVCSLDHMNEWDGGDGFLEDLEIKII